MKRSVNNKPPVVRNSGSRTLCVEQVEDRLLLTASGNVDDDYDYDKSSDWNGDGFFNTSDLVAEFAAKGSEQAASLVAADISSQVEPGIVNLIYDPSTGGMSLDTGGLTLTTLELVSADELWRGEIDPEADFPWPGFGQGAPIPIPFPQFDVYTPDKAFNLAIAGFGNLDPFGAMDPGLTCDAIAADLTANGSLFGGGGLPGFAVTGCDVPPEEAIENLAQAVIDLDLASAGPGGAGVETALLASLTGNGGALAKLQDDNPDNDVAAIGKLQAFINKVEAQRGNRLTDDQADDLVAAANDIIGDLEEEFGLATPDEELLAPLAS